MKRLTVALMQATGVGMTLAAFAVPAVAQQTDQQKQAQRVEKIEVTGSSIRRVEGEGALPVTVISREEIEKSGATNAMELLQLVSANNSLGNVALSSVIGSTTFSAQTASLRGLQGGHTLVLINGKRVNGFAGETQGVQGVNLAIIPFSAVERVEVLKDGASAVYGSDAIAGVINFIMRSDYKGAEAQAWYGQPTRSGGGAQEQYYATLGFGDLSRDRYNVFANASYNHQKPLYQNERNFSNNTTDLFLENLGGFAGSSNTFPGNITTGGIGILGHSGTNCGAPFNRFVPDFGIGCTFDPATMNGVEMISDDKNTNFFVQGKFQLTPSWQLYGHGLYGEDKNRYRIQPVPISNVFLYGPNGDIPGTITLPVTSPFYPHAAAAAAGVDGKPLNVRWRAVESGLRDTTDKNTGYQLIGGIKGSIADRWDSDLSYSYAQGKLDESSNGGFPQYSCILPLLNSGNVNLFGPNSEAVSQQVQACNYHGTVTAGKATTESVNGKISGDIFTWAPGTIAGAVGLDLRKEKLDENPSAAYVAGDLTGYGGNARPVSGDRDVTAFFAEVNVPLLRNLELDAALRTDKYSDFGRTNNPKVSLRWQPTRQVLVRSSYGTGFLAPSLYQLKTPNISGVSQTGQSDPIRCPVTHNTGIDCQTQFPIVFGGNSALHPETSEQITAGIVFEPISAFSLSADYFKIRLSNAITNGIPVTTILGDIGTYGNLVTRGPVDPAFPNLPGPITGIDQRYINLGATHIEGIDVEAHYKWPATRYGRVRLDLSGTYYIRYDSQQTDGSFAGTINTAFGSNVVGVIPRWKHYAALSYDLGPWSATVANTYQSSYTDWQTDFNGNERQVGSMSLWDLQGAFSGLKHWVFTLGVKNVLDTNPPATNQQNTFQLGFDPSYYDPRARFVYGAIKYEFR
ncbi:MAG TPA: TonB-dependent receptor [Usitatibacter sp.]|nr:TonB-dependent receptor [Usitatibacter sp.]